MPNVVFTKRGGLGDFDLSLLERLGDTSALVRHLRAYSRPDYFASLAKQYPDAVGDWIDPAWIKLEKVKKIYPLYEDGAGNCVFFCESDRSIWDHDHETGKFVRTDHYQKRYTLGEPYKCLREYLFEVHKEDYVSPYAVEKTRSGSPVKPLGTRLKNAALTGIGLGTMAGYAGSFAGPVGAVVAGTAGAVGGAYLGYNEDASISGIAPVAPPQGAVQQPAFPKTGVVKDRKKPVVKDAEFELGVELDL